MMASTPIAVLDQGLALLLIAASLVVFLRNLWRKQGGCVGCPLSQAAGTPRRAGGHPKLKLHQPARP